jgi:hypothetical protein
MVSGRTHRGSATTGAVLVPAANTSCPSHPPRPGQINLACSQNQSSVEGQREVSNAQAPFGARAGRRCTACCSATQSGPDWRQEPRCRCPAGPSRRRTISSRCRTRRSGGAQSLLACARVSFSPVDVHSGGNSAPLAREPRRATRELRAAERRPHQECPAEAYVRAFRAERTDVEQVRAIEMRVADARPAEVGADQGRPVEVGARQVRAIEPGVSEACVPEVGATEIRTGECCARQQGMAQLCPSKIRVVKIDLAIAGVVALPVPSAGHAGALQRLRAALPLDRKDASPHLR